MKLRNFFYPIEEFDRFLLDLKPGDHARVSNAGKLVVQKYTHRKIQLGGGKFLIKRRK